MTRERASAIAHGNLPFHNPLELGTVWTLIDLLELEPAEPVLDVGCGRGELLIQLADQYGTGGEGIDTSAEQIAVARSQAAERVPAAALTFTVGDASSLEAAPAAFAVSACVGSTHALGGLQPALERLAGLTVPGGYVLVGEGYWQQQPGRELLELLGAAPDELPTLPELLAAGEPYGLAPVYAATATDEDWCRYEWSYVFNLDRYLRDHPDEEGLEELRARLAWARERRLLAAREGEALGFALVAWRRI